jgi:DNA-directed RNA polymerase subunit M/transcription elongation factor TFIIS
MRIAVLNEESLDILVVDTEEHFNLVTFIIDFLRMDMEDIRTITEEYKYIDSDDHEKTLKLVKNAIMDIFPQVGPLFLKSFLEYFRKRSETLTLDGFKPLPDGLPGFYVGGLQRYFSNIVELNSNFLTQILTNELAKPSEDPEYLKIEISYYLYNYRGQLYEAYQFEKFHELIFWGIIKIIKAGLPIKECRNCHKVFIPQKRSDEIYCDYIYSNSRTCKQVGYENKDEFTKAYRTAYKTKNAAKNRNIKNNPNAEKNFRKWVYEARLKLEDGREGKISLEDFKGWLRQGNKRDVSVKKIAKSSITNEVWADTIKRITERSKKNRGG